MALPCEMLDEILHSVPVKYILRCRCVCKEWCSLIDSTAFAKMHCKTTRDSNAGLGLMITKRGGDKKFYMASLNSLNDDSAAVVEIDDPLKAFLCDAHILGSSNGLMCVLKNDERDVFLLNPTMRKYKMIVHMPTTFIRFTGLSGFGYDCVNDDYKIIMIGVRGGLVGLVYSLKTNTWTWIERAPTNLFHVKTRPIYAGGSLHWMTFDIKTIENNSKPKDAILGFDLGLQQFKEVPFPPIELTRDRSKRRILASVGEYLCILDSPDSSYLDVWLMNYPAGQSTWHKALSTEQEEILETYKTGELIACIISGKDLLLQLRNPYYTKLVWYNLDREMITNVQIRGLPLQFGSILYTENLLNLIEDDEVQQKPSEGRQKKITQKRNRDDYLGG